jgi:hypothetical protein
VPPQSTNLRESQLELSFGNRANIGKNCCSGLARLSLNEECYYASGLSSVCLGGLQALLCQRSEEDAS